MRELGQGVALTHISRALYWPIGSAEAPLGGWDDGSCLPLPPSHGPSWGSTEHEGLTYINHG